MKKFQEFQEFPTDLMVKPKSLAVKTRWFLPPRFSLPDASFNINNPLPKIREAAPTVFTQRPPQQEKLNGGS
jgi:hypothetical protein